MMTMQALENKLTLLKKYRDDVLNRFSSDISKDQWKSRFLDGMYTRDICLLEAKIEKELTGGKDSK